MNSVVLRLGFLLAIIGGPLLAHAADEALIESNERTLYVQALKKRHAVSDERTALQAQINTLLTQNALLRGYQFGQQKPEDIIYSVQAGKGGTLNIREERRNTSGQLQVSNRVLHLYGTDPFFGYQCLEGQPSCSIGRGSDSLLRIVKNRAAADEISRALSYLVRELQR